MKKFLLLCIPLLTFAGAISPLEYVQVMGNNPPVAGGGGSTIDLGPSMSTNRVTTSPYSFGHTVDSDTELLVVFVYGWAGTDKFVDQSFSGGAANYMHNGCSYGAAAMTVLSPGGSQMESTAIWYLVNPTPGSNTIQFGAGNVTSWTGGASYYAVNVRHVNTSVGASGIRAQAAGFNNAAGVTATATVNSAVGDLILAVKNSDDSSVGHEAGFSTVIAYPGSAFNGGWSGIFSNTGSSPTKDIQLTGADFPGVFCISIASD